VVLAAIVEPRCLYIIRAGYFFVSIWIQGLFSPGELCSISDPRQNLLTDGADDGSAAVANGFSELSDHLLILSAQPAFVPAAEG
jgi:hypothetical protein